MSFWLKYFTSFNKIELEKIVFVTQNDAVLIIYYAFCLVMAQG